MIRVVVFDLDGTLVDSATTMIPIVQRAAARCGLPARATEEIRAHWGPPTPELFRRLWPDLGPERLAAIRAAIGYTPESSRHLLRTIPGLHCALDTLACRGVSLALLTNRSWHEGLRAILRNAGIPLDLFRRIQTPDDGTPPKPHVGALEALLRECAEWGITSPEEVCLVSDRADDAIMARRCGCWAIGVLTGSAAETDFAALGDDGVRVVHSVAYLPRLLATLTEYRP